MISKEYIEWTRTVDMYPEDVAFDCYVLGLCSEAGEVAGKLKKEYRDEKDKTEEIKDEVSDVFWYLARICDEYGMTFEDFMAYNHAKIEARRMKGTIKGDGDGR